MAKQFLLIIGFLFSIQVMSQTGIGTVVAWGNGDLGFPDVPAYVPANLSGVTAIAAGYGYAFSLALKSDGTVVAWSPPCFFGLFGRRAGEFE